MIRKNVSFFAGFLLILMSCNLNMLDAESEEVFKQITESKSVKIYEDGKNLNVDLFGSDIPLSERSLFSSGVAIKSFELANPKRSIIHIDGNTRVSYLVDKRRDSYTIPNRELFIAEEVYGNLGKICQSIIELNKPELMLFIDNRALKSNQIDLLVDELFNEFNDLKDFTFNTYGFEHSGNLFFVYMRLNAKTSVKRYRFDFNIISKKMSRLNKLNL